MAPLPLYCVPISLYSLVGRLENAEGSLIKSSLDHVMLTYYGDTVQVSILVSICYKARSQSLFSIWHFLLLLGDWDLKTIH